MFERRGWLSLLFLSGYPNHSPECDGDLVPDGYLRIDWCLYIGYVLALVLFLAGVSPH